MTATTFKKLWKNDYFQTAVMIILVIGVVFGSWYASQLLLNTEYPALAVASASMVIESGPFGRTLQVGDLIVVQGVNPKSLEVRDIIVFHRPQPFQPSQDELIVHRIIAKETNIGNGMVYFETKGDANPGPDGFDTDYRVNYTWQGMIAEKLVVGRVIMRVPWVGHISLFMRNSSGLLIVIALIVVIIVLEFAVPALTRGDKKEEPKQETQEPSNTRSDV